ncbi:hypothetical protein BD0139_03100 [Helicobacter pylori]
MKKVEWNEEQRKAFQDLLREFKDLSMVKNQPQKKVFTFGLLTIGATM